MRSKIERVERPASVPAAVARKELAAAFPGSEIISFKRIGKVYVASIRTAEFPPPKGDGGDAMGGDKPLDLTKDMPDDGMDLDLDADDDGDLDLDGDGDAEDKEDKIMDMLEKIMDHLGIGEGMDDEGMDEAEGLDLPDVGAPEAGAPMGGKPMGDEMPPPVAQPKSQPMAGGAFSHNLQRKVGSRRSFVAKRTAASDISNRQIINEAVTGFPGYRVAKINRQEDGSVLIAMVAKR